MDTVRGLTVCNWICKRKEEKGTKAVFERLMPENLFEERYQDTNTEWNIF